MLYKLSRYAIIVIIIIISAIYLPKLYQMLTVKGERPPIIYYSAVIDDFVYYQSREVSGMGYYDRQGNEYTRKQYERLLPFLYYRDLDRWGVLPDTLHGVALDISDIRHNRQFLRIKPTDFNKPEIQLFPLFESQSVYSGLEYPDELFRIKDRMEFITAATNTIDDSLSQLFTQALNQQGFQFPARVIGGNPSTHKPFDEGYFIVDRAGHVFHLKKSKGRPACVKTDISPDLQIRKFIISEHPRKEFYGLVVTHTNKLFLISYDQYKLIPLPAKNFDADKMKLSLFVDPLNRTIRYTGSQGYHAAVTDTNYHLMNSYTIKRTPRDERLVGKIEQVLFPFQIKNISPYTAFIHFKVELHSWLSLIGIMIALAITFSVKKSRKENIRENWGDFVVVALAGLFGCLAVLIIKPEVWD